MNYILDDEGQPVPCDDIIEWGMWFESANRHVGDDIINGVRVSTVFLGIDHHFSPNEHVPLLWETMIFGGDFEDWQMRHCTRSEAIAAHAKIVQAIRAGVSLDEIAFVE